MPLIPLDKPNHMLPARTGTTEQAYTADELIDLARVYVEEQGYDTRDCLALSNFLMSLKQRERQQCKGRQP